MLGTTTSVRTDDRFTAEVVLVDEVAPSMGMRAAGRRSGSEAHCREVNPVRLNPD
jgi:hypothetical protein